jgi:hypothetical protein
MTASMATLKLQALDAEDLGVLSAHCQDATVRVADLAYVAAERRFALVCNRFDWLSAQRERRAPFARHMTGLRFERVNRAQLSGFSLADTETVLSLLAIEFSSSEAPAGQITLLFAAGAAIRLNVEYIEAELKDLGGMWSTQHKPDHTTTAKLEHPPARDPNSGT